MQVAGQEKLSNYATSSTKSGQKAKWLLQQLRVASQLLYCQKAPPFSKTKCPLSLTDEPTCSVSEHDSIATLISMTHIMVVDEVTMMDRCALEAADHTFQ